MIAFFAATPYQLFTCINLLKNKPEGTRADLYIMDFAVDMTRFFESAKASGAFENVYLLDNISKAKGKFGVIKDFIFTDKKLKSTLRSKHYDELYITYVGDRNNLFYNVLLKKNKDIKLYFYDEGIGVYVSGIYESSGNMKRMFRAMNYRYVNDYIDALLAYSPEAVSVKYPFPIEQIPKVSKSDEKLLETYQAVFDYKNIKDDYSRYKFIYMDQPFGRFLDEETFKKEYRFEHSDFLKMVLKYNKPDEVIVKKHPITSGDYYEQFGFAVASQSVIPWEIIQLNQHLSDCVLMTVHSTTVFTPKMIFDEEPYVIILAKAIYNEGQCDSIWNDSLAQMVEKIRSSYRNPERFFLPESYAELDQYLKNLN